MRDFVSLGDVIPDIMLDVRYYSTYNFIGDRVRGYNEPVALLSSKAALALVGASEDAMKLGCRLKVYDAYRPQTAVEHFKEWAANSSDIRMKRYFYPTVDKSILIPKGYIADRSSHSRGSTVDLTLFSMNRGQDLDMGSTFDYFGSVSHVDYKDLSDEQITNRNILQTLMARHGFVPLNEEWWHFTLKNEPFPDKYFYFPVERRSVI